MSKPLTGHERGYYERIDRQSIDFLMERYNPVNRWVVADLLRRSAYRYPDKDAVVFGGERLSYAALEAACNQTANALLELGVERFDRVALLAHNTVHHVETWFGCCKAGAVYLALNYLLNGKDLAWCVNHSGAKVLIVEDSLYELVADVLEDMPGVKALVWSNQGHGEAPADARFRDFDAWIGACPASEPEVTLRIEDICQMTYTSGTESLPKGVLLSNQALLAQYMGCIVDGDYRADDVNVIALPLYHCAARDVFLNPVFWVGGTNVLITPEIDTILRTLAETRATMFFAPPTVWIGMLRHPGFDQHDLSALSKCYYGASIMPVQVLEELMERLPHARVYNYYGQTELAPYHTVLKPEDAMRKLGSAGMGGINMETRLEDEAGDPIETPGVPGEICGRGPHALSMYFKEPEKTEAVMRGGWFHSGDIGVLDEDRYIEVVDRKKDMIKTGGENVATREVEEAVYRDSRVEEVAVLGLPHPKWVEAVTAFVKVRDGESLTEAELLAHCRRELAAFKVPKKVVFVEALPKSPSGKILKREIRAAHTGAFDAGA